MYGRHGKIVDKTPNTPGDADLFVYPNQDKTGLDRKRLLKTAASLPWE